MRHFLLGLFAVLLSSGAFGKTLYTFNGGGTTGSWTTTSTWTTDPTGSTSIGAALPTSADDAVVTNSYVVTLDVTLSAPSTPASITIQRGGVLDLTTNASGFSGTLARLAGQGILRIARPFFPAVTTNDFDDANTGTVEFYNWATTPAVLPQPASNQYNNLRLVNTTAAPGTPFTARLENSLTLKGSLTLLNGNYVSGSTLPASTVILNMGSLAGGVNRTLTVEGNVAVGGGTSLGVTAANGNHFVTVNGNFTNTGTVNLYINTSQDALLTFVGAVDARFACNGPTDLSKLKVDKGLNSQVLLDITGTFAGGVTNFTNLRLNSTASGNRLDIANGVTKLGGNIFLPIIFNGTNSQDYNLGSAISSPTLWINGATVQVNGAQTFAVYGKLRVSGGLLEVLGNAGLILEETGEVLMEGGTVSTETFKPFNSTNSPRGSFTISGGLFDCAGTVTNGQSARFSMPYPTQSIRLLGGRIRLAYSKSTTGTYHVGVNPDNAVVTGGIIEVVMPDDGADCKILSTAPVWNMTISKAVAGTGVARLDNVSLQAAKAGAVQTAQPLTVLNNLTVTGPAASTFDANLQNVTIKGTFTIGTGCSYLPTTNTTTFSGNQNQLLTNDGSINTAANTFYNWVVDKSAGTLTLAGSATTFTVAAGGTLSLLNGVLNDGGKRINVLGGLVNSASHTSGGGNGSITLAGTSMQTVTGNGNGVFGNLTINSGVAAGGVAATFAANMSVASKLNFVSNTILVIGANRLSLTNVDPSTAIAGTFSAMCMIRTAGNQSDLGLQKTYGGTNNSFTFPVGTLSSGGVNKYTPATITLNAPLAATQFGQVSVSPTNMRSPFVTNTNSLAYYWKVRSSGFTGLPANSINESFRAINADAPGSSLANYIPGYYLPVAWTSFNDVNIITQGATTTDIPFTGLSNFDGEFTTGVAAAFGPVTAYYSIANGIWATPGTWKTVTGATVVSPATAAPGGGNPVFIGSSTNFHTVTVDANGTNAGSLVIESGSTMDVGTTTGHNFGALPDAKVGGAGRLRISSSGATAVFPGGDFGSFIQPNGGTVEYYSRATTPVSFTLPTISGTLTLNSYQNLWLNATAGNTITLPQQDLRIYNQMVTGTPAGSPTVYAGDVYLSAGTLGDLRIGSLLNVAGGKLHYSATAARSLTADADVRVDAAATFDVVPTGTANNDLTVGGTLTNNGILNFSNSTGAVSLIFTGAQNNSFTGPTGTATTLRTLTLNKGLSRTPTLTVDMAGTLTTPTSNWLTLTNGTLRYAKPSSTLTIHNAVGPYSITDNAGLTVDATGAVVTVATDITSVDSDLKLAGELQVTQGTLNIGTTSGIGNDLEYASAGAPTVRVSTAGTLFVNGQVRRSLSNTNGSLRYVQSGGTTEVAGIGATGIHSNYRGLFEVQGLGSIFRMTGGTLALRRSNGQPLVISDLYLRPDSTVVTAGTVALGNNGAGAGTTVSVSSAVPLYDLRVEVGADALNPNIGLLSSLIPLTLKGSLTIANNNAVFNANGQDLNIDQNLVNNNSSVNNGLSGGGFRPITAGQTTTFTSKGAVVQQLTSTAANLTVFGNLVLNNARSGGTLQLGRDARVFGTLTLAKGTLADGGQTITALGDVVNSAVHTSTGTGSLVLGGAVNQNIDGNGTGRFGNVTLNNVAGATTLANQEITNQLTLSAGVLTIGSNLLWLSNPALSSVAGTLDGTRHIRTNGIVADLGLRKSYPSGAQDFTFPVGASGKYTPVRMNVTSNTAVGTLTVQPIDRAHPSTTNPAAFELNYYWKVSSTGFSAPTVSQEFAYVATDVNGTEGNYKVGRFLSGAWVPLNGIATSTVDVPTHRISNAGANYFDGDYTGADASAVPSEFGGVPTYYSRNATAGQPGGANWDAPATPANNPWTFNSDGTDSMPLPTIFPTLANPVVVRSGHLINANGPSRGAANLLLNGTLDLAANGGNNFNVVTGTGTLRIGSALFPAGNFAAFVAGGTGGTVDYTAGVQLPARDTYNNLTLSGANTKQLSNLDLNINGALALTSGTTITNPTSQSITLTSATSGATLSGVLNLNDGALTTTTFLTNTGTGTLTLGAGLLNVGTTFSNAGTVNNGSADVKVGTDFANSGTYNANNGAGSLAVGTSYANSGTYNAGTGTLDVTGDFNNTAGTFNAAVGDVNVGGNFANAATYNGATNVMRVVGSFANSGAYFATTSTMVLRGNFSNTNSFDPGTSLAQFLVEANRTLTGTTTFSKFQKLGTSALLLGPSTDVTVSNLLTLQSGTIITGTVNTLFLTNQTIQPIVGTGTGAYVAGRLAMTLPNATGSIREFPVGLGGRFRPVTIKTQGATLTPVVVVEIFNSKPPGTPQSSMENLSANRYYRIQQVGGGTITSPTVQLSFNTDVVDEKVFVPGNLRVARTNGPLVDGAGGSSWATAGGAGVYSPEAPRGYTISAPTTINTTSFFALGSTNAVDNPLTNTGAPLPVELLKFTALAQSPAVRLAWTTASEKNTDYFTVQRSADGRTFGEVGRVVAQGNSNALHEYALLDATPLNGLNYYRLRQVDNDGTAVYSPVVTVRFGSKSAMPTLLAYPNPASGQGFRLLTGNLGTDGGLVQLRDNLGRIVFTQTAPAGAVETLIQPAHPLPNGLYLVSYQAKDGQTLTTKVVVE